MVAWNYLKGSCGSTIISHRHGIHANNIVAGSNQDRANSSSVPVAPLNSAAGAAPGGEPLGDLQADLVRRNFNSPRLLATLTLIHDRIRAT